VSTEDFKKIDVRSQMSRSRYNHKEARYERLENDTWVPWPVLRVDKYALDEARRVILRDNDRGEQ
jgi:hypothetical protein